MASGPNQSGREESRIQSSDRLTGYPNRLRPFVIGGSMDRNTLHYHIRWSSASLYWQRFNTHAEANVRAIQLMRPGETYTIEKLDADCPRCLKIVN
jgi:hypothetical protein